MASSSVIVMFLPNSVIERSVGDQGNIRPGTANSGILVHDRLNSAIILASQAVNGCCRVVSEIFQGSGSACSGSFHDVAVDHGGGDVGMAEEALVGADVGAGFEQVCGEGLKRLLPSDLGPAGSLPQVVRQGALRALVPARGNLPGDRQLGEPADGGVAGAGLAGFDAAGVAAGVAVCSRQ